MAVARGLTIAGMEGYFVLRFRTERIANVDEMFRCLCGERIEVLRYRDGRTYRISSSSDHFRVWIRLQTPDRLESIVVEDSSSAYGWWQIDGLSRVEFSESLNPSLQSASIEELASLDSLGIEKTAEPY
ncbi:hypothetical protein Pan44_53830 [Caulifigura coniformis]|uniref:Uncharacterized protein n=1 Tax=Caulifigura coniformis TaxID=2527983 RepID=A0A517SMG6_9PLAN|nr:hypothetical protein [Caulifigura coniformis]QDT57315.1 hypothetical protein Pan44_53830 [Caulifigura coniformis]